MVLVRQVSRLAELSARKRRLLVVFAHPDDEAYGAAGALARTGADPAGAAVLLCLTNGEASTIYGSGGRSPEEVARLRTDRLLEVAGHCDLDGLILPGLPDGRLARVDLPRLGVAVSEAVLAFDPQVVVSHDPRGVNAHPDHIAAHWACREALRDRPDIRFAMVAYLPEDAAAAAPRLLFGTPEEEIDAVLELSAREAVVKEACLRTHEAIVTLSPEGPEGCILRPAVEHYDFLGEDRAPPLADLFD